MENQDSAFIPPKQEEGVSKDFEETIALPDLEDAEDFFLVAKDRLLHINQWHEISTTIRSTFRIVDKHGHPLHRRAHSGDYVMIDIPAPDSSTGMGADWVMVEKIEYDDYPDDNKELIAMRLRPVSNPLNADHAVAHFFTDNASSSFIIERDHTKISAKYHGRNEKPNTDTETLADTVRNVAVAAGAILGFSDVQWKGLLKGFLSE
jgi:hypothetical protein